MEYILLFIKDFIKAGWIRSTGAVGILNIATLVTHPVKIISLFQKASSPGA
jgi:hypothetical protein